MTFIASIQSTPVFMSKTVKVGPYRDQAEAIVRRRKQLKLSQTTVAEIYGGQQGYISDIERGWVNFAGADAEWFERMGRALQMEPSELMSAVGVKYVIASSTKLENINSGDESVVAQNSFSGYAPLVIWVTNSGPTGGGKREMTIVIEEELAQKTTLEGLYLERSYISAVGRGMLAIFENGASPAVDEVVIIEYQGERHAAYALPNGMVATDTPINPRIPVEFQPDRILGVVRRAQQPSQPRRLRN